MSEDELKKQMRQTAAGKLLVAAGFEPYDTESSARRVAEFAALRMAAMEERAKGDKAIVDRLSDWWALTITGLGHHIIGRHVAKPNGLSFRTAFKMRMAQDDSEK